MSQRLAAQTLAQSAESERLRTASSDEALEVRQASATDVAASEMMVPLSLVPRKELSFLFQQVGPLPAAWFTPSPAPLLGTLKNAIAIAGTGAWPPRFTTALAATASREDGSDPLFVPFSVPLRDPTVDATVPSLSPAVLGSIRVPLAIVSNGGGSLQPRVTVGRPPPGAATVIAEQCWNPYLPRPVILCLDGRRGGAAAMWRFMQRSAPQHALSQWYFWLDWLPAVFLRSCCCSANVTASGGEGQPCLHQDVASVLSASLWGRRQLSAATDAVLNGVPRSLHDATTAMEKLLLCRFAGREAPPPGDEEWPAAIPANLWISIDDLIVCSGAKEQTIAEIMKRLGERRTQVVDKWSPMLQGVDRDPVIAALLSVLAGWPTLTTPEDLPLVLPSVAQKS